MHDTTYDTPIITSLVELIYLIKMVTARSLCPPPASGRRRIVQDTDCTRRRLLGGGLHEIQSAEASRVLLLLNDGGGRGRAGRHLVDIHVAA